MFGVISRLTTQRKIQILIFTTNTFVIILFAIAFIIPYYFFGLNQIKTKLSTEAEEILTKNIRYDGNKIIYIDDKNGQTIQNDLITDGASAIIFNEKLEQLGIFGVFEINSESWNRNIEVEYSDLLNSVITEKKYYYQTHLDLDESENYQILFYPIKSESKTIGVLVLSMPMKFFNDLLSISFYVLLFVTPFAILVNYFLADLIVKLAFQPLKDLINKMNLITIDNTKHKVEPIGNKKDATYQLTEKYNEMLDRVGEASVKQRNFISNVSHELKSPLTRVISGIEVLQTELDKGEKEIYNDLELQKNDLLYISSVINNMLVLSKIKKQPKDKKVINVKKEIEEILSKYENSELIQLSINSNTNIKYYKDVFKLIMNNLIENAYKHGDINSIRIKSKEKDSHISIIISNKISSSKKNIDNSSVSNNSYGLGLKILESIIEENGLNLEISEVSGNFKVTIEGFEI